MLKDTESWSNTSRHYPIRKRLTSKAAGGQRLSEESHQAVT